MELQTLKDFIEKLNDNQKEDFRKLINEQKEEFIRVIDEYKEEKRIKTGYEKPLENKYWYVDGTGDVEYEIWENDYINTKYYDNANAYSIKEVAEADARADLLMRKLRRFAKLNNKKKFDWSDYQQYKYYIQGCCGSGAIRIYATNICAETGNVYFAEKETAQEAVNKFKDELKWYFTKYVPN